MLFSAFRTFTVLPLLALMFAANHKTCKHIIYNHLLPGRWLHRKLMPTEIRGLNPKETDSSSSASEITSFYLMNILTVQLTPEQRDLSCMGAPICRVFSANNRRSTTWPMAGWIHRREITDTIVFSCVGCWRSQTLCCSRSTVIPSSVTFSVTT